MRRNRWVLLFLATFFVGAGAVFAEGLDVTLTAPVIVFDGQSVDTTDMQTVLAEMESQLENDPDLQNFQNQQQLALAFANAGAASTHLATQRSFSDYRAFALVVGTGGAIASPDPSVESLEQAGTDFEENGDVYFGAALQPVTVSLGFRIMERIRINGKFGYFVIDEGQVVEDMSFSSMTIGGGLDYQLLRSRSVAFGVFRWRGLSVGTGVNYQANNTEMRVEVQDESYSESATFGELNITPPPGHTSGDPVGSLTVTPSVVASVESRSWSIPLEVTTGLRILYLLDVNVGAGVDVAVGSSTVLFGAESELGFEVADPSYEDFISVTPGSADFGIVTESEPQFIRPRLTAGVGLNLGPIKLDVPVMYYLDDDGPTAMAGVNVGLVW